MKRLVYKVIGSVLIALCCFNYVQAQNTWTQKATLPAVSRYTCAAFSIGDNGYVGTGQIPGGGGTGDFWEWNQPANTWKKLTDFPGGIRFRDIGFAINGIGYIGLGTDGSSNHGDLWAYNPVTHSWSAKTSFPGSARYGSFCFVIGDKAYIGGGSLGAPPYLSDFWEYDAAQDKWTQKKNFHGDAREHAGTFTIANYGYVCGGFGDSELNDFWQYDPATDAWTKKQDIPGKRSSPCGFTLSNKGYMGLGVDTLGKQRADFYEYNALLDSWSAIESLPDTARHASYSFAINNYGYIGAGYLITGSLSNTYWQYGPVCSLSIPTLTSSNDSICKYSGIKSKLDINSSNYHLQWQSSIDGSNFQEIVGDTTSTYITPPLLDTTTYYRVSAENGACSDVSNIVIVHIIPSPVAVFNFSINNKQVTFNSNGSSPNITSYYWDFGDSIISIDANPVHSYTHPDNFNACLTVYNGSNCSYTLCKEINLLGNGIENITGSNFINLYPNPAHNAICIACNSLTGNYTLHIFNVLGQEVINKQIQLHNNDINTLSLTSLPEGSYELILSNGKASYAKRFIHLN